MFIIIGIVLLNEGFIMKQIAFIALLIFSFQVYAVGFTLEGKDLEDCQLVFETTGVDFSNPDSVVKGIVEAKMSLTETRKLYLQLKKLELNSAKKFFTPILSNKGFDFFLGNEIKSLLKMKKRMEESKLSYTIKITDKKKKANEMEVLYAVNMQMVLGKRKRSRVKNGKVILVLEGKEWKVKGMYRKGWKSYRPDRFLQGPKLYKNFTKFEFPKLDMTTPDKAFATFIAVNKSFSILKRPHLNNRMCVSYKKFIEFFGCKALHGKLKTTSYRRDSKYGIVKTEVKENTASVSFKLLDTKSYRRRQLYKLELSKKNNQWFVDSAKIKYSPKGKWSNLKYLP